MPQSRLKARIPPPSGGSAAAQPQAWGDHNSVRASGIVGMIGIVACVAGASLDRAAFFEAWLITWLFLLGIALASMAQVMIHELTGGDWGRVLRPPLEAATLTLPLVALFALPLAFGLPDLFAWAREAGAAQDEALRAQQWYLAPGRFLLRNGALLVIWSLLGIAMVRSAGARAPAAKLRAHRLAVAGLLVYLVTVTLTAFDWIAALMPGWYSSALGVRVGTAEFLASLAFAVPVMTARTRARGGALPPPRDYQDFGNLLLTYSMMWAYIAFTQYLIVWAEDLPQETSWFWPRAVTSWRYLVWAVVALEFALPVMAMLFRGVKRSPPALALICVLVLLGQWLDTLWLVAPSVRPAGFVLRVEDLLALVGMGGVWLAAVLYLLERLHVAAPAAEVPAHG